jgi:hypothetical protein
MDVFTVAGELLGDLKLSSGQLGQLRALDYRLLLESLPSGGEPPGGLGTPAPAREDFPSAVPDEQDALRRVIVDEILQILTPEQHAQLNRR